MHAFEQAMMDDAMLADAVDGYIAAENINIPSDLAELEKRLEHKNRKTGLVVKTAFRQWMSIAASLVILLSLSVVLYRSFNQEENKQPETIARLQQKTDSTLAVIPETKVDSAAVAVTGNTKVPVKPFTTVPTSKTQEKTEEKINAHEPVTKAAKNNSVASTDLPPAKEQPVTIAPVASAQSKISEARSNEAEAAEYKKQASTVRFNKFIGQVVDEKNNPLPFANITEKNSGVGTYADVNGYFNLLSADSILNVETKSVGYSNSIVQLKTNESKRIVLKDDAVIANAPTSERLYNKNKDRASVMKTEVTEAESEPVDGWRNYSTYIANNLRDDQYLTKQKISTATKEVEVSFDVNPDGTVTNLKVEHSNCSSCNKEAIRIIQEGPGWKSTTGKKQRARFTVKF